jgi:hypothetical protein
MKGILMEFLRCDENMEKNTVKGIKNFIYPNTLDLKVVFLFATTETKSEKNELSKQLSLFFEEENFYDLTLKIMMEYKIIFSKIYGKVKE